MIPNTRPIRTVSSFKFIPISFCGPLSVPFMFLSNSLRLCGCEFLLSPNWLQAHSHRFLYIQFKVSIRISVQAKLSYFASSIFYPFQILCYVVIGFEPASCPQLGEICCLLVLTYDPRIVHSTVTFLQKK